MASAAIAAMVAEMIRDARFAASMGSFPACGGVGTWNLMDGWVLAPSTSSIGRAGTRVVGGFTGVGRKGAGTPGKEGTSGIGFGRIGVSAPGVDDLD